MYPTPALSSANSSPTSSKPQNIHHHMSYFRSHNSSPYAPGTQQSDIARLLDPSYASASSSGSSSGPSYSQSRVYVDQHGDLHDPDYRDFPIVRSTSRSRSKRADTRRDSAGSARSRSTSRAPDRFPTYQMGAARPSWEGDWRTEVDDEDEDDEEADEDATRFSPFALRRATSPVGYAFSTYVPPHYSNYFGEPIRTSTSPVGSYEEGSPLADSPFYEDEEKGRAKSRRSSTIFSRTKRVSWGLQREPLEKERTTTDDPENSQRQHDESDAKSINVYVSSTCVECAAIGKADRTCQSCRPTCSASLRRQWQALVLRFQFNVFHAKRRLASLRRRASH